MVLGNQIESATSSTAELEKIEALILTVPRTELKALWLLSKIGESHGPAIARASNWEIGTNSIYTLLKRLEARGEEVALIHKEEKQVPFVDITTKRVVYRIDELVSEKIWLIETILGVTQTIPSTEAPTSENP